MSGRHIIDYTLLDCPLEIKAFLSESHGKFLAELDKIFIMNIETSNKVEHFKSDVGNVIMSIKRKCINMGHRWALIIG